MSDKGPNYEREICRKISLWWSSDQPEPNEDIFWRSQGSGGRAKRRGRKGKKLKGQDGDIAATDPIGQLFISMFAAEIKRGYNDSSIANIFDKPSRFKTQEWEEWLLQLLESWQHSGSHSWLLITKRDKREPLIFMEQSLWRDLQDLPGWKADLPEPSIQVSMMLGDLPVAIQGMHLSYFLETVQPRHVVALAKKVGKA